MLATLEHEVRKREAAGIEFLLQVIVIVAHCLTSTKNTPNICGLPRAFSGNKNLEESHFRALKNKCF